MKNDNEHLIPPHGGYCKLVTYKLGSLIYDATAAFCEHFIDRKDRTFDQMVQAARSGVANIVEGSEASAASKKTELKLTNVAKASQEELLEDYRSFLRQRTLPIWEPESETAKIIRQARPENLTQLRQLMALLVSDLSDKSDKNAIKQEVAANTMICLINQETFLLARQITRLAADFEKDGGFTERLYRIRSEKKKTTGEKMKKLLLILFALGALFLTGCYETITGYKLVGEYQSPAPLGYWDGSKLNYDKDGGLKLSIALGESALSDFSTPQLNEVKLPGKIALSVANTIRKEPWPDFAKLNPDKLTLADVIKLSPFLSGIYSGQISPGFCLIYDKSQLKSIAVFAKKSYLQILNPKSLSVEKEIKIGTNSLNFVSKLACSDDLQYLAIAYRGIESFYHTIDIYELNQESNTYQFRNRFDQYSKHYREMSFGDMKIDNGLLMIKLNKGARRTIKTSRILFYNLKKNLIESVYALRDVSFVNSAAVTPDLEYLIIVKESLKLYRRNSKNAKDK